MSFFPVHTERWFSSASWICWPADWFFPRFTQILVSSSTSVRLCKVLSFHHGIVVGISFIVMCFGGVFFPSRTDWESVSFPIVVWVISPMIALRIRCCGFIVVCGLLFAQVLLFYVFPFFVVVSLEELLRVPTFWSIVFFACKILNSCLAARIQWFCPRATLEWWMRA